MSDKLADHVSFEDPYHGSAVRTMLTRLINIAHPEAVAAAGETFLKRLTLLEMVLEDRGLEIGEDELNAVLETRHGEVEAETYKLAQLFFGRVSSREG